MTEWLRNRAVLALFVYVLMSVSWAKELEGRKQGVLDALRKQRNKQEAKVTMLCDPDTAADAQACVNQLTAKPSLEEINQIASETYPGIRFSSVPTDVQFKMLMEHNRKVKVAVKKLDDVSLWMGSKGQAASVAGAVIKTIVTGTLKIANPLGLAFFFAKLMSKHANAAIARNGGGGSAVSNGLSPTSVMRTCIVSGTCFPENIGFLPCANFPKAEGGKGWRVFDMQRPESVASTFTVMGTCNAGTCYNKGGCEKPFVPLCLDPVGAFLGRNKCICGWLIEPSNALNEHKMCFRDERTGEQFGDHRPLRGHEDHDGQLLGTIEDTALPSGYTLAEVADLEAWGE